MSNPWFRVYSEFATDPKVQMMSESDQRRFVMVLCIRCSNEHVTLQDDEMAFQLRISNEQWAATKAVFLSKNLINEDNTPTAWDKRQFVSDSSAERVAKHRAKKKQTCNVTVTAPEADTDTDTDTDKNNPVKESCTSSTVVATADTAIALAAVPTRKGEVCGLLRKAGMQDAAPHYLTEEVWVSILSKRTNEEIIDYAKAKMAANPGKRIGLKYLAPGLLEDAEPIAANARASPANGRRQTLTETRTATIAALTGRNRQHERTVTTERDITGESCRVE